MKTLEGKIAIVTGAGRGIGAAIVKRYMDDGCAAVVMFGRRVSVCEETAKQLDPEGKVLFPVQCDVSDREQVKAAFDLVMERFGRIDILVNCAGITKDHMFHKMTEQEWDAVINVNLNGTFNTCHLIAPVMRANGYGRIINFSSTSAWGNAGQANYAATKAAVLGFTATLAREMAAKGVIVNAIAPGAINTDMMAAVPPEAQEKNKASIPMGRFGEPEEIAAVASFLAGPDVSYLTGQVLCVNGGKRTF